tara:strand:- start:1428 stop:2345 length:918 start_codon:yes stop_codon:yes gene_type:complete
MINLEQNCVCPHCNKNFLLKESLNRAVVKDINQMIAIQIKTAVDTKDSEWETKKKLMEIKHNEKVNRLNNDMRQVTTRLNQGSVQSQGEAGEVLIEETLNNKFPNDDILEIPKGKKGADILHKIKANSGKLAGTILYESKITKIFKKEWIPKLKKDMSDNNSDIGVIITATFPKGVKKASLIDGIWVCNFYEFEILSLALRENIMNLFKSNLVRSIDDNVPQKIFEYLISNEFKLAMETMLKPIQEMEEQIKSEENAFRKQWKLRRAMIANLTTGALDFTTSVQYIVGSGFPQIEGLSDINQIGE